MCFEPCLCHGTLTSTCTAGRGVQWCQVLTEEGRGVKQKIANASSSQGASLKSLKRDKQSTHKHRISKVRHVLKSGVCLMLQKYSIRNQQGRSVQTRPPTTQPLEPAPASSSSTFAEIWLRKRVPACVALSCLSYLPELRACNQLAHASKCNNIKRHARDWIFAWTASRVAGMAGVQVLLEK